MTNIPTFKCVLVGDAGVGKTSLIRRHLTGEFVQVYDATLNANINPLVFNTTSGPIRFCVWDCAGQEKFGGLGATYYVQADCAIVMFDLTSRISYNYCRDWIAKVRNICGDIPIILVGNKFDIADRKVMPNDINLHREINALYYDISVKSNYQFEKPFLGLAQMLMHDANIQLVD